MINIKNKKIIYIFTVISILGAILLIKKSRESYENQLLIKYKDINQILLEKKDIKLLKKENIWYVNDHLANQKKVDEILKTLVESKIENFITSEEKHYKDFNINDSGQIKLFKDNNLIKKFSIGKPDNNFSKSYVKIDKNIYLVDSMISRLNYITLNELRDKTIFNLEKNQLESLTITKGKNIKKILKKDNQFQLDGKSYKNLEEFIDKILFLRVHQFKSVENLKDSKIIMDINLNNKYNLSLFEKDKEIYCKLDDIIFNILPEHFKKIDEFKFE